MIGHEHGVEEPESATPAESSDGLVAIPMQIATSSLSTVSGLTIRLSMKQHCYAAVACGMICQCVIAACRIPATARVKRVTRVNEGW